MAKIRCGNCGRKISADFDFCPSCGWRVDHAAAPRKSGFAGCAIAVCLALVACAVAATVWLVREHDHEEYQRVMEKQRDDSLKTAAIAAEQLARRRADSIRLVNDSVAEAQRLTRQLLSAHDLIRFSDGRKIIDTRDNIISVLRDRGYQTLRRTNSQIIMALNAELVANKINAKGAVFSAVSLTDNAVELLFHSPDACTDFIQSFPADAEARLTRLSATSLKITN